MDDLLLRNKDNLPVVKAYARNIGQLSIVNIRAFA